MSPAFAIGLVAFVLLAREQPRPPPPPPPPPPTTPPRRADPTVSEWIEAVAAVVGAVGNVVSNIAR